MNVWHELADRYREFASQATESPCFATWSLEVAADSDVLEWLSTLPHIKQQPNLVFAAARWHGVHAPGPYAELREAILGDDDRDGVIRRTILARSTQTNEVGRLATLAPAFGLLQSGSRASSLIEVGASAGLCLYPDRYAYRWSTAAGDITLGSGPELTCRVQGAAPLPSQPIRVAHRAGIDLNPLDVENTDEMAWLENLVWPEQADRRERLHAAIAAARSDPPSIHSGDLLERLPEMVHDAGRHGPVVVFHSAVIAYLDDDECDRFDHLIRSLVADGACRWVSNESKHVLPSVTATGPTPSADHQTFVLGIDGQAVAWTHGHGRSMRWLEA